MAKGVVKVEVTGADKVAASIAKKADDPRYSGSPSAVVGYTASYALYVHEDLTARHPVGQAKYLEQPAREMAGALGKMVSNAVKSGRPLPQALLLACLSLQRVSQLLVPVDTGALKNSAFSEVEEGA